MVECSLGSLGTPIFPSRIRAVLSIPTFPKLTTFSPQREHMVYVRTIMEKNLHHENSLQVSEVHDLQDGLECRGLESSHALRGKALTTGRFYLTPIIAPIRVICSLKNTNKELHLLPFPLFSVVSSSLVLFSSASLRLRSLQWLFEFL
jgi:hypothetical protein